MKRSLTILNRMAAMALAACAQSALAAPLTLGNAPLYLSSSVPPLVMLTVSKDHSLYSKAYNDYSDLDGDGQLETTYKHGIDYAGYFDSYKCYSYDATNNYFYPVNYSAKRRTGADAEPPLGQGGASANNLARKYCNGGVGTVTVSNATAPSGAKVTGTWSGNFLNWASMARIDVMRLVLFGGTRSTDSAVASPGTQTIGGTLLERTYLPNDAHSWSKYYNGSDIANLTPFNPPTAQPSSAWASGTALGAGSINVQTSATVSPVLGDQVMVSQNALASPIGATTGSWMVGTVISITSATNFNIQVVSGDTQGSTNPTTSWTVTNLSRTGISICNTTLNATAGATYSQQVVTASSPPLIRVAKGNYSLWSANERWQCRFFSEKSGTNNGNVTPNYANSNGNRAAQSQISASAENPSNSCTSTGLCVGTSPDYVARVAACVGVQSSNNLNGEERCKQYTNGNFKPAGLLQTYGDGNLIQFGLMTGSYDHNVSGGVVRKNVTSFQNEVNYTTDGTFTAAAASGIVGNLNKMRLYGYNHTSGVYNDASPSGEGCGFQLIEIVLSGADGTNTINEGNCGSWGNPMSEMYLESLRYFAGAGATTTGATTSGSATVTVASTTNIVVGAPISDTGIPAGATVTAITGSNVTISSAATATSAATAITLGGDPRFIGRGNNNPSKDATLGLTSVSWVDPVSVANYCAPLNVMMFNPAISSYDDVNPDQMNKFSDVVTSSPAPTAPFNQTMDALTKAIGDAEGITGNTFFIGNASGTGNDTCVPKTVSDLSLINGICPEAPGLNGSYRMAGAAWYAHMNRIRQTFVGGSSGIAPPPSDTHSLKVNTYGVQLATNTPKMVIPVPGSATQTVTIQPTYRLDKGSGRFGGGTLVDFKVVTQDLTAGTGTFYINYEDSGQGGDYDQDIWGRLSYCIKTASTTCPTVHGTDVPPIGSITITTDIIAQSTALPQGWGFVISGTTQDGMHFMSGILNLTFNASTGTPPAPNAGLGSVPLDSTGVLGCTNCVVGDPAKSWIFTLSSTSNAGILKDPLYYASKWGGFKDNNGSNTPDQVGEFDVVNQTGQSGSDGQPDNYYFVTNPLALQQSLDRAFIAILTTSSASSVATNTTQLRTGAAVYQASFNTADWSGELASFSIDLAGNVNQTTPLWTASQQLAVGQFDPNTRVVITYNPSHTSGADDGTPFRYCPLTGPTCSGINDATLRNFLNTDPGGAADGLPADTVCNTMVSPAGCTLKGKTRVNYLRGDATFEGATSSLYRVRPNTKLGDVINSTPNFVGVPSKAYFDPTYIAFRNRSANLNRRPLIYVGGNDGMLHAFDAGTTSPGAEVMAYVPGAVYRNLTKLTGQTYNNTGSHQYFVDGNAVAGDVFIDPVTAGSGTQDWATVLVGGLNAGGKGLYALNITDPSSFTEANAGNIVLWEFTNSNDPDLGYTFSTPVIARMANGRWAAIIGNGYNNSQPLSGETACTSRTSLYVQAPAGCKSSADGHASLFIIFIEGGTDGVWTAGTDYIKLDTGTGTAATPAGLSSPLAMDVDGDDIVDFIYAGDLNGKMWKFDVSSATPAAWHISFSGTPLYVATDASGNPQPIQDAPEVTLHPNGGQMVMFGTGKYLEPGDDSNSAATPFRTQSMYGIWDQEIKVVQLGVTKVGGGSAFSGRSALMPQSIYCSGTLGTMSNGGVLSFVDPTKTCSIAVTGAVPPITNQFRLTSQHQPNYGTSNRSDSVVDPSVGATSPGPATTGTPPTATVTPERGWYLDFPNSADTGSGATWANTGTGERVKDHPILSSGKLVFATLIPSNVACELGGSGFIFDLDPITGGRLGQTPIDVTGDGVLDAADLLGWNGNNVPVSASRNPASGIPTAPTVIAGATVATGSSTSSGGVSSSSSTSSSSSSSSTSSSSSSSSTSSSSSSSSSSGGPISQPLCAAGCEIKVISTSSKQVITIRERGGSQRSGARLSWRELIQD